ncbi:MULTISPECIES: cytochrome c peroxidase [Rhodopseudomonas]|uniref:cytochrome-c peroxidase n=1 Tax=Rhodopseudomonas TaxID=1073 RepID=UPI000A97A1D4|nr:MULTISPECIES: cytochrome c peroxidase [Rhodopseudomonas]MDF3809322.1 cytochrome c peroxidase [Rhodopseudomonas sp. BAL398]WOK19401.1 cytochrome c peroxidase [Rhodopseudomonas sp. BAL398]
MIRPGIFLYSLVVLAALGLTGATRAEADGLTRAQAFARAAALEALGAKIFADRALSRSGQLACSSCHDPAHGFGPGNDRAMQFGGKDLRQTGFRATPALTYLQAVPQFSEHYYESEDEADASIDNGPTGGLTWDGRVDHASDQARIPLLAPFEMDSSVATVAAALRKAAYAGEIKAIFGDAIFNDPDQTFAAALKALAVYQQNAATFYPYSSKYDAYLAGRARLTDQEARGLAAFNDPAKGNCGNCHRSERADDGSAPQFSDFGMIALGVPRNRAIAANADPGFFDLGLCGPLRADFKGRDDYCGLFRAPSLRNVALRKTFFHNGVIKSLHDAVEFYATRDTDPGRWYPRRADGSIDKFDDLPARYRGNINMEPPFGGKPGDPPALSSAEIDDIVAFLGTLTDGYRPAPAGQQPGDAPPKAVANRP